MKQSKESEDTTVVFKGDNVYWVYLMKFKSDPVIAPPAHEQSYNVEGMPPTGVTSWP